MREIFFISVIMALLAFGGTAGEGQAAAVMDTPPPLPAFLVQE